MGAKLEGELEDKKEEMRKQKEDRERRMVGKTTSRE